MAAPLTRTKRVKNLTSSEYRACYNLNLRGNGLMRGQLQYARKKRKGFATMRFNPDGSLAAWALTFPCKYNGNYLNSYFYVRKNQRRKGLGKHLVQHVNKKFGMVRVYPHDKQSTKFFNFVHRQKLNVERHDDYDLCIDGERVGYDDSTSDYF